MCHKCFPQIVEGRNHFGNARAFVENELTEISSLVKEGLQKELVDSMAHVYFLCLLRMLK